MAGLGYLKSMIYKNNPDLETILPGFPGVPYLPPPPGHKRGGRFTGDLDSHHNQPISIGRALHWQINMLARRRAARRDARYPRTLQNIDTPLPLERDCLIWLGHSGFLLYLSGRRILIDPCFAPLPMVQEYVPPPPIAHNLGRIDYLLISHGHMDHLNAPSLRGLHLDAASIALLPLDMGRIVRKIRPGLAVQEAGWFQRYNLPETDKSPLEIIFLPARHWHRRSLRDQNSVLWGSYLIRANGKSIYFAGDTGPGEHFRLIREACGPVDWCLLPIGAYDPSWLMQRSHMGPEEALDAFAELGGRRFLPMHWGTYRLSSEPMGEPIHRLQITAEKRGLTPETLVMPSPGEIVPL